MILYAEHDFNASTFSARVTVSTLADFYSGITSGNSKLIIFNNFLAIGTLRGSLHGGANEAVMYYLNKLKTVEESNQWLDQAFAKK